MSDNDELNLDSLFEDDAQEGDVPGVEHFSFDEDEPVIEDDVKVDDKFRIEEDPGARKPGRSSKDFEMDMDVLLITAQSSMIIEGIKYLTKKDFSAKALPIFTEAINGIDLYIKILERNPENYYKLAEILHTDIDCREVEKTAFNLYRIQYNDLPSTDDQKLRAYEVLKERLNTGHKKAFISQSMVDMKKYYLMSGEPDQDKLKESISAESQEFKVIISRLRNNITAAIQLLQGGDAEIAKGIKGKDVNIFVVKGSKLLYYYYYMEGNTEARDYYKRLHNNSKKYFIIQE